MAFGDAFQKRMNELAKRQLMVRKLMAEIAEGATLRAVETAVEKTPPNTFKDDEIRGVHTITGELAQHWQTDSQTVPVQSGTRFITTLANNQDYSSYVNDGHRMDKHFVPGLYIDDSGILSYDPKLGKKKGKKKGKVIGIVVGTKTKYVPGRYMKEAGVDKYKDVMEVELHKLVHDIFK